jgi:hypothetical protein
MERLAYHNLQIGDLLSRICGSVFVVTGFKEESKSSVSPFLLSILKGKGRNSTNEGSTKILSLTFIDNYSIISKT